MSSATHTLKQQTGFAGTGRAGVIQEQGCQGVNFAGGNIWKCGDRKEERVAWGRGGGGGSPLKS